MTERRVWVRHLIRLALIAGLTGGLGCGSVTTPSGNPGPGTANQSLSALINGLPWTANGSIAAEYTPSIGSQSRSALKVVGSDSPVAQTLDFTVRPALAGVELRVGTYDVGSTPTNATLTVTFPPSSFEATGQTGSGSVTIVTFNTTTKRATGTFSFLVNQVGGALVRTVSSGTFDVTFR